MEKHLNIQWKQAVITLTLAFGAALVLNWAVLKLFGQKSADRAEHSLVGIILLMAYTSFFADKKSGTIGLTAVFFFTAVIPCYLGTIVPDLDIRILGIGAHRNPIFHSGLSFIVIYFVSKSYHSMFLQNLVIGYGIGLASHLWWDVLYYGDVRWLPGKTIDMLWLGINGLLCLVISEMSVKREKASDITDH